MLRLSALLILLSIQTPAAAQVHADEVDGALALQAQRFLDDWRRFRHRYIAPDGRVIDSGNGDVSHSEGQGYAMLFAAAAGDRQTFDEVRLWTQQNLQRRDGLHYWRFDPRQRPPITDPNSAADGELLIAWALVRASRRWSEGSYMDQALVILDAFEQRLIRRIGPHLVVIPWDHADLESPRVINLSYFVFPAIQDIAVELERPLWLELYEDCLELVEQARFGRWQLPPDWLAIDDDNGLDVWSGRNPYFSYDAIRVPLHLVWAGHDSHRFIGPFVEAWRPFRRHNAPDWFDLTQQGRHSRHSAPPGLLAVREVTESIHATIESAQAVAADIPDVYVADDYYSSSLILLARLAELEWWMMTIGKDGIESADR